MKTEDTRAEITYLPQAPGASFFKPERGISISYPEREISISYVLDILRRRRKMVLWIMALSLGAGLILALRPKTYLASGMLQIRPGAANVYKSQANEAPPDPDSG